MKCSFCELDGERSTVTIGPSASTCMAGSPAFYDEGGTLHAATDPNWYTTEYFCSRGHRFSITRKQGEADAVRLISTTQPL